MKAATNLENNTIAPGWIGGFSYSCDAFAIAATLVAAIAFGKYAGMLATRTTVLVY